jgi:hypothetical protein
VGDGQRDPFQQPHHLRSAESQADRLQAILNLSDYIATELPILPIIYDTTSVGTGKGVKAFDDLAGGGGAGVPYGLYTRNAHLWDRG